VPPDVFAPLDGDGTGPCALGFAAAGLTDGLIGAGLRAGAGVEALSSVGQTSS